MDAFFSSSEAATEEEVTRPIGWNRVKTAAQKGKGKEDKNSQSGFSFTVGSILSHSKEVRHLFY
jgi:hypothetical protein